LAPPKKIKNMAKQSTAIGVPNEIISSKIYLVNGYKVMLDRDLAELYGVETKYLKRQVKRNIDRFPKDFMFEMSQKDFEKWRSQFVTSKEDKMGLRYAPFCFTEHGVLMLSSVINSTRATEVNIQIMRTFTKLREILLDTTEIRLEIEKMKKKLDNHDKNIDLVLNYLDELIEKSENPPKRKQIGFKK